MHKAWQWLVTRWTTVRVRGDKTSEKTYLADLAAAEPRRRWQAASGLGRNPLRSPEAIETLIRALADPEPIVRWHVVEALAAQEVGHVFPVLVAALADPEPLRRAGAAEALGRLGGEAAGQALLNHLADPEPDVRAAVASGIGIAVGQAADPAVIAALLPLLSDPHPDVRRAGATALGRIGNPVAAVPLAQALMVPGQPLLVRRALAAALAHVPHPDTQPQLLAALSDPDPQVRGYAARTLGHAGDEHVHAPLAALAADKSRLLRGTVGDRALRALALLERRGRRQAVARPTEKEGIK